jgi:ribose 5-phosphate isomerase B
MKNVVIASDHGGFELKSELVDRLRAEGAEVEDLGVDEPRSVDYPVYAVAVAREVVCGDGLLGVLVCGTGQGMAISANKVAGCRAAVCSDVYSAKMVRRHNDANVLCLGGRVVGVELAHVIMRAFLQEPFEGGRHKRRVDLINRIENDDLESFSR